MGSSYLFKDIVGLAIWEISDPEHGKQVRLYGKIEV
jgi:hypothetical protein